MKIIDLLKIVADDVNVPPKIIKYNDRIFEYKLWLEPSKFAYVEKGTNNTLEEYCCFYDLNEEIEILDEEEDKKKDKKIERFDPCLGGIMSFDSVENIFETYKDKINEIIDKLNKEE